MNQDELANINKLQDSRYLAKCKLPEHDKLLSTLRSLMPSTGNFNELFCNVFLNESVEMLKHAFFLYEDGFFDCAFYSIRQSIENINNMLISALDSNKYKLWKDKGRFPHDKAIKEQLNKQNAAYNEIKNAIPEFFEKYEDLLKQANKIIHKQGFDTFYTCQHSVIKQKQEERTLLFVSFLKYGIGMILIMNIVLDPLALALSDSEVDSHIPFEPMTEAIPLYVFEEYLSIDIINKIRNTSYYLSLKEYFLSLEKLNDATYLVLRYEYFDVNKLDDIEKQLNQLGLLETLMFCILRIGIEATHFYCENSIMGYSTSIEQTMPIMSYSSNQFDEYLKHKTPNYPWQRMYITGFKVFESYLIIQHNNVLSSEELSNIEFLINIADKRFQSEIEDYRNILNIDILGSK